MGLENTEVVDAVGTEPETGTVVLTIIDAWDWSDERYHLVKFQEKLNAYFEFVETGQLFEEYPDARGRLLRIDWITRVEVPASGLGLLAQANAVALELDLIITHHVASE